MDISKPTGIMTVIKKLISETGNKKLYAEIILILFWYLSMFPGRLGFDTKLSLEMLRRGESTDWWTSWYWRILQLFTLEGKTVIPFTFVAYSISLFSYYWLLNSLVDAQKSRRWISRRFLMLPIFPVFSMTVQHDVFLMCGIFLWTGLEIRSLKAIFVSKQIWFLLIFMIPALLSTTHQGVIISFCFIVRLFILFRPRLAPSFIAFMSWILILLIPNLGIAKGETDSGKWIPVFMDIKCVVQDKDSSITYREWKILEKFLPISSWQKPYRCDEINSNDWLQNIDYSKVNSKELLSVYLPIMTRNGETAIMAHIARSNFVLPPPFFPAPPNQVNLNLTIPIGESTNVALQNGPPLLHPSVDDQLVRVIPSILLPIQYLAQIPVFLVNQASWFWGWGGLWLLMIILNLMQLRRRENFNRIFPTLLPFLTLHGFLFAVGISSTPRHVSSTVIFGVLSALSIIERYRLPFSRPR